MPMSKIYPKNNSEFNPNDSTALYSIDEIYQVEKLNEFSPSDSSINFILNYSKSIEIKEGKKTSFIYTKN